jgi:hypothetical protein
LPQFTVVGRFANPFTGKPEGIKTILPNLLP